MSDYHILSIIYDHLSRYMMFLNSFSTPVTNEHWPLMHWNFPIGFQEALLMAKPNSEF